MKWEGGKEALTAHFRPCQILAPVTSLPLASLRLGSICVQQPFQVHRPQSSSLPDTLRSKISPSACSSSPNNLSFSASKAFIHHQFHKFPVGFCGAVRVK